MTEGPTTENGPLHSDEATVEDREMVAYFSTPAAAQAAKQSLIEAGFKAGQIDVVDHAAGSAQIQAATQPADPGIIGRLREAVLPDDSQTATRVALRDDDAVLTLRPTREQVETAVAILKGAEPSHFDADLELWRNAG
jgi:hypothetical protein